MATPFAALESRLNAAVLAKCANATAMIAGQAVEGVFDAEYQEIIGVSAIRPSFSAGMAALAGVTQGAALTITCTSLGLAGASYTVAEIQPEYGMTRLMLRKAA